MHRKILALSFLLVMTMVIALKHPVLGYCACLNSYFTGNCLCEQTSSTGAAEEGQSCNGCCSETQTAEKKSHGPCDDCSQQLSIDTGDFVWDNTDNRLDSKVGQTPENDVFFPAYPSPLSLAASTCAPIRGGPPPPDAVFSYNVPVYLKHSVLRL